MSFDRAEAEKFVVAVEGGFTIPSDTAIRWGLFRQAIFFEKKEDVITAVIIGYHAWRAGNEGAKAEIRRALGMVR